MKLEEIISNWTEDCKIDRTQLDTESLNTPTIHNKYYKIYMSERMLMEKIKLEYSEARKKLLLYYSGKCHKEELKEMNREQYPGIIISKDEMEHYVATDPMMVPINLRQAAQKEKIEYLRSIITNLEKRGFLIKNALEFMRFTKGEM